MGWYRKAVRDGKLEIEISLENLHLWRALAAEFIGTFLMVAVGCLSVFPSEVNPDLDNLVVPGLCFAGVIVTLIHVIGPTSGCNINPSVTLALVLARRKHWIQGLLYFVVQMLGAISAAFVLWLVVPEQWCKFAHLCMTRVNPAINVGQAVVIELIATGVLVLIVMVISDPDPHKDFEGFPSLAGGIAVMTCVYAAAPYTGASLNPARSFGPALVNWEWANHWVSWVGPLLGSVCAVGVYKLVLEQGIHQNDPPPPEYSTERRDNGAEEGFAPTTGVAEGTTF